MRVYGLVGVALSALVLSSCQSDYTSLNWQPIIKNPPPMEMAVARCEIMSNSVNQGYFAVGSPDFVAGAALGNALGNAMNRDRFIKQCMTFSGYRIGPKKTTQAAKP